MVEYNPLTIADGMTVNGDCIRITDISDLNKACDLALNVIQDTAIPQIPHQQRIDTAAPVITVGTTVDDTLDPDVFTVPITVADDGSGVKEVQTRLVSYNNSAGDYCGRWTLMPPSSTVKATRKPLTPPAGR